MNAYPCDWRFAYVQGWPVGGIYKTNKSSKGIQRQSNGFSDVKIVRQSGTREKQQLIATLDGDSPAYIIVVAGGVTRTDVMPGYEMKVRFSPTGNPVAEVSVPPGPRPEELVKSILGRKKIIPQEPVSCTGTTLKSPVSAACAQDFWRMYGCTQKMPEGSEKLTKENMLLKYADIITKDEQKCFGRSVCADVKDTDKTPRDCARHMWHKYGCIRPAPEVLYYNKSTTPGLKLWSGQSKKDVEEELSVWIERHANVPKFLDWQSKISKTDEKSALVWKHNSPYETTRVAACLLDPPRP